MFRNLVGQYKGLPKQVYIILIARTVAAMGAFVYPFVTMFLSSRLGFSDQTISYYLLVLSLSYIPAALLGGKLADKFNRKYVYITVLLIADCSYIIAGFLCHSLIVIIFIFTGLFCMNMANPVMAAMMMDITTPENRQESMSLCYLGLNLGIAIGPLIAGILFENHTPWIFWGQGMINASAMLILIFGIKDARPSQEEAAQFAADEHRLKEQAADGTLIQELLKRPVILIFALIAVIYAFAYAQMSYMMPLHLEDVFGIAKGSKYVGIIWSLNGLSVFLLTPVAVYLFKRFDSLFNISLAGLGYAVGFGLYAFTNNIYIIWALVVVWSAGEVMSSANCGVFIANNAPVTHRARFQSIYDIVHALGRATGPLIMGMYLVNHTITQAWILVAVLCFGAFIAYYVLYKLNSYFW